MLCSNLRTANRTLAVPRTVFGNQKLVVRSFGGTARSSHTETMGNGGNSESSPDATLGSGESKYSKMLAFMDDGGLDTLHQTTGPSHQELARSLKNSPIFTATVDKFVESRLPPGEQTSELVPQYGLIGARLDVSSSSTPEDGLILGNVNMPWSAFICGSQGAGKSHTLCCLLENALVANNEAGALPRPLAGMVMHYDRYSSHSTTQICEAAYLCSSGIPLTILVSPSNVWAMKRLYSNMPGLPPGSPRPKVIPLYLDEDQLDISRILKLMAVDPTSDQPPLYMEALMSIVREMAMSGEKFTYTEFRKRLSSVVWLRGQELPLNMRLQLLDSFLSPSSLTQSTRPAPHPEDIWAFEPGSLTIVDLSDPFINSDEACTLFSICLSIFLEGRDKCGRIVALDEAHKFLAQSGEARVLTKELVSVIRQQRHTGTRAVIATQEPTLSPELIALSNATFVHRFLSPAWYEVLKKHLAGANQRRSPGDSSSSSSSNENSLFRTIVGLRTGQALLFCPTALMDVVSVEQGSPGTGTGAGGDGDGDGDDGSAAAAPRWPMPLNDGYVNIRIRKRLTVDGGKSIMATDVVADPAPKQLVVNDTEVPMFVVARREKHDKNKGDKEKKKEAKKAKEEEAYDDDEGLPTSTPTPPKQKISKSAKAQLRETILMFAKEHAGEVARGSPGKSFSSRTNKQKNAFFAFVESMTGAKPNTISNNSTLKAAVIHDVDVVIKQIRRESEQKRHDRKVTARAIAGKEIGGEEEEEDGDEDGDEEGPNKTVEQGVLQYVSEGTVPQPVPSQGEEEDIPETPEREDHEEEGQDDKEKTT